MAVTKTNYILGLIVRKPVECALLVLALTICGFNLPSVFGQMQPTVLDTKTMNDLDARYVPRKECELRLDNLCVGMNDIKTSVTC